MQNVRRMATGVNDIGTNGPSSTQQKSRRNEWLDFTKHF